MARSAARASRAMAISEVTVRAITASSGWCEARHESRSGGSRSAIARITGLGGGAVHLSCQTRNTREIARALAPCCASRAMCRADTERG
jgi:hypothetical protein